MLYYSNKRGPNTENSLAPFFLFHKSNALFRLGLRVEVSYWTEQRKKMPYLSHWSGKPGSTPPHPVCLLGSIILQSLTCSVQDSPKQCINNEEPQLCLLSLWAEVPPPSSMSPTSQFLMSGPCQYGTTFWHSYLLMNNKMQFKHMPSHSAILTGSALVLNAQC